MPTTNFSSMEFETQLSDWERVLSQFEKSLDLTIEKDAPIEKIAAILERRVAALKADDSPLKHLYPLFDRILDHYIDADQVSNEKTRKAFGGHELLLDYLLVYAGAAEKEFRESREAKWLLRALAAFSVIDFRLDFRDLYSELHALHDTALELGMDPEPYFQQVAARSNSEETHIPAFGFIGSTRKVLMEYRSGQGGSELERHKHPRRTLWDNIQQFFKHPILGLHSKKIQKFRCNGCGHIGWTTISQGCRKCHSPSLEPFDEPRSTDSEGSLS